MTLQEHDNAFTDTPKGRIQKQFHEPLYKGGDGRGKAAETSYGDGIFSMGISEK